MTVQAPQRRKSGAALLAEVGAVAIPRALDTRICSALMLDIDASPGDPTTMISDEDLNRRNWEGAQSTTVHGSPFAQALVELVLAHQLRRLEKFFERPLEWNKEFHFLVYEQGGFIRPHRDVMEGGEVLEKIRERVVLFSLFLNGRDGPEGEAYEGGEFMLHPTPERDLVLSCKAGLLLAFRADLVHSVREITAGTRYSVSGWFREPIT
jgi:predicted 2-oxoglutarate/Fe(II)-dependent dioxygenase YbiX